MAAKDLYIILQVPPTATTNDIKKAYRKLAQQYHPDKNPDDELAAHRFLEIKQAYEVLGNTAKRQQYAYENWQHKKDQQTANEPITPAVILQKMKTLAKHVSSIDIFRMSHAALFLQIINILSAENILVLQQFNDAETNKKIIETTLKITKPLSFDYIQKLEPALIQIAFTDNTAIQLIYRYVQEKRRMAIWDKYNVVIILIISLLICFAIFWAGK